MRSHASLVLASARAEKENGRRKALAGSSLIALTWGASLFAKSDRAEHAPSQHLGREQTHAARPLHTLNSTKYSTQPSSTCYMYAASPGRHIQTQIADGTMEGEKASALHGPTSSHRPSHARASSAPRPRICDCTASRRRTPAPSSTHRNFPGWEDSTSTVLTGKGEGGCQ